MVGLSPSGFICTSAILALAYTISVGLQFISYYLNVQLLGRRKRFRRCKRLRDCSVRGNARKTRRYLSAMRPILRRSVWVHIIAALLVLLLLCGDVHPNPGPVLSVGPDRIFLGNNRHPGLQLLYVAAWNVRTLLESRRTPIRPTAIVARELDRYNIDIAALSETRILGESVIEEVGGGYTFFLKGKPVGDKHYHGVGFAIRTKLVKYLDGKFPVGSDERLMSMSIPLEGSTLSIISAYAPTLPQSDEIKDRFYGSLGDAIDDVPASHKLLVLGDFNARVGTDHTSWENTIGSHGVGNGNSVS